MRVWDEERLLKELAVSREARTRVKVERRNTKPYEDPVEFLLVLVRKCGHKQYEFLFIPGNRYEYLDQVYINSSVVTVNTDLLKDEQEEDMEYGVWIGPNSSNNNEKPTDQPSSSTFEPYYVGKAIFHTSSGEPLMKVEGSTGWKEALKQKYLNLDSKSRIQGEKLGVDDSITRTKAIAAAAIGGGAAAGGSSIMAANAAAAAAANAAAFEAWGAGGFAASGGFGAVTQTAVVAATPVGVVAAAGALGGLGLYYVIHRRNKAKKEKELVDKLRKDPLTRKSVDEESQSTLNTEDESGSEGDTQSGYQQLNEESTKESAMWITLLARKTDSDDSQFMYLPSVCDSREDAEVEFQLVATNTIAKALINSKGKIVLVEAQMSGDQDGWETALSLHFDFLVVNGLISALKDADDEVEETPLLKADKEDAANEKKANNWVFASIRKRREQLSKKPGPGTILTIPFSR